jgi:hypothetical protein
VQARCAAAILEIMSDVYGMEDPYGWNSGQYPDKNKYNFVHYENPDIFRIETAPLGKWASITTQYRISEKHPSSPWAILQDPLSRLATPRSGDMSARARERAPCAPVPCSGALSAAEMRRWRGAVEVFSHASVRPRTQRSGAEPGGPAHPENPECEPEYSVSACRRVGCVRVRVRCPLARLGVAQPCACSTQLDTHHTKGEGNAAS